MVDPMLYYRNGYMPIPLIPGEKRPIAMEWQRKAAVMDLNALWKYAPGDVNLGIYCGEFVIIIDGDAHDEANIGVTGKQVMDWLWEHHPEAFKGAIKEITAGMGSHTTYRWTADAIMFPHEGTVGKTFCVFTHEDCPLIPEGVDCRIELLTRNSQAVAPPSMVKGKAYCYVSEETHLNTARCLLPELPELFRKANKRFVDGKRQKMEEGRMLAEKSAAARKKKPEVVKRTEDLLNENDLEVQRRALVEHYTRGAGIGARHKNALGLARTLAGLEYHARDVERSVREFFSLVSREERKQGAVGTDKEINDIVDDAMRNPDSDPPRPWKAITNDRKRRTLEQLKLLDEVKLSDATCDAVKTEWNI